LLALNFSSQIRETDDLDIFAFLAIAQQEYRSSLLEIAHMLALYLK
jgi:hypothetical protein